MYTDEWDCIEGIIGRESIEREREVGGTAENSTDGSSERMRGFSNPYTMLRA